MKTVQITLDDELTAAMDQIVKKRKTTRSAFARKALQNAIIAELEQKHKKGYDHSPVGKTEFSVWESEQAWGDNWLRPYQGTK